MVYLSNYDAHYEVLVTFDETSQLVENAIDAT